MTEVTPDNAASEIDRYDMFVESNGYSTYVDYLPKANGDWVRYDDHTATVAALEAEVERLRQHSYDTEQAWLAERVRAEAAERRVAECLRFIDGVRDDLHNRRTADWFPEGAHDAATSMSEDMRLIGNACAEFDPYQDTGARAK